MFQLKKTNIGNKLTIALVEHISKQPKNTTRLEMEEIIYEFLQENKEKFKRNHPENLELLQSSKILMLAYTNDRRILSVIEILWID